MNSRRSARSIASLALTWLAIAGGAAEAQESGRGRIAGVVTDEMTGRPLAGVSVTIQRTAFGAVTDDQGRYLISSAPTGVFNLEARRLGFGAQQIDNVRIRPDSTLTIDITMSSNPLRLSEVVVAATVDPTSGLKSPITSTTLNAERDIPVKPNTSAAGSIQGKVAGAKILKAGGAPGTGVFVQLRSPVSQFGTTSPLYVIDGVFLNSEQSVTTADVESMDIASVEVIKGAAAASLYGSRAAGGVISITTNRGKNLSLGSTQLTVRTEYGMNQFARELSKPSHHQFRVNEQGQYVNAQGQVVPRNSRVQDPNGIMDNPYIDQLYDHAGQFFKEGSFNTQSVSLTQNTAATNFNVAFNRYREEGVVLDANGITRSNLRVNIDHRIREVFSLGLSAFHNRSLDDVATVSFNDFYRIAPDIDLLGTPDDPRSPYPIIPDPTDRLTNPLYRQYSVDDQTRRMRTLISGNMSYRPFEWLTFDAIGSYDRGDRQFTRFTPRGITQLDGEGLELGSYRIDEDLVDGINAQAGATAIRGFGGLTTRLTLRGETQREWNQYVRTDGSDFSVTGVRDLDVARSITNTSTFTDRRANAGFVSLALDYGGKYIGDFLVRREGSSLFGPDGRWNNFYRASGAWLLSEESWWPIQDLTNFKLRYSIGTAGTRPTFSAQYENLEVEAGGGITRQSLGNRALRPEIATEQEYGLDAIWRNRVSFSLVYASLVSDDNLIEVPVKGLFGYNTQWQNVGKTTGNTLEATLQAQILNRPNGFQWELNLVADRSRNKVAEFNRSCYTDGILNRCEGVRIGSMWGTKLITSPDELPTVHADSRDEFQINDDGYLVPVGTGNSYTDGLAKNLWGRSVVIDGVSYQWGRPMIVRNELGNRAYVKIGDANPDLNYGIGNTFRWKGLSLYGLFTGQIGGHVYNLVRQRQYASGDHEDVDQFGRADELKKPVSYYSVGLADNVADYMSEFVEDGTYIKLSELSLRYTIPQRYIRFAGRTGLSRVAVELIGRNVFSITDYSGLDPEAGSVFSRIEDTNYPQTRTWTAALNLAF